MNDVKKKPAAKKPPQDPKSKLHINNEMAAFDRKDRGYYDSMSNEEKKKFSTFTMIRWGSTVAKDLPWYATKNNREGIDTSPINSASTELQSYYLMSTNEHLNKNYFDISAKDHEKLLWLLATTVSPGMGKYCHEWIPAKKEAVDNKAARFFRELYPHLKDDDIKLLTEVNDKDDLKRMAKELGWDDKQIKSDL